MEKRRSWPIRFVLWVYGLVNSFRRFVLNLLFFVVLAIFISALVSEKGPVIENNSALVLAPHGIVVEQASHENALEEIAAQWGANDKPPQTQLRDLIKAIREAKTDPRIKIMVIDTRDFYYAGFSQLAEIKDAIVDFKTSGKKVIARADYYSQSQYYLAAQADEIYMDSMGFVEIDGFAKVQTYFKGALDKLGVKVHVFRVGTFKSAVEPFIRDNMSEEDKANTLKWMGAIWDGYKKDIASARKLTPDDIQQYADNIIFKLSNANGDTAQMAMQNRLIDGIKSRIEFDQYVTELVGRNAADDAFKQIDALDYAATFSTPVNPLQDNVAIIVAQGEILDGSGPSDDIYGDDIAEQIRNAREDENVKAVVLRVNSPGGSAFASEVIRRELQATQEAGKPVVASMSTVAASGGYWISASSDEIFAHPYTITGSIGIFGMLPTIDSLINEYGIHRDGVGTTKLAGTFDIARPLSPELAAVIQHSINNGYERFLTLVGNSRKKSRNEVDAIAQGQVWDGAYASTIGLVDKLGTLDDAVKSAAEKAKLGDDFGVRYIEREMTPAEHFAHMLSSHIKSWMPNSQAHADFNPMMWEAKAAIREAIQISKMNDPQSMYAHCMCVMQ